MKKRECYHIAYDVTLKRPACVLMQAVMGGTVPGDLFIRLFDADSWLLAPTEGMKLYRATSEHLDQVAAMTVKKPVSP